MLILIFDTETTGLPKSKIINMDVLHLWPHIVQFSYIIFDTETNIIVEQKDWIIKISEETEIDETSVNIHGITKQISLEKGVDIKLCLNEAITLKLLKS